MLRKWEVQPGMGEAFLAGIGNDVRRRRQIGPSIQMMDLIAQANEGTADILLAERGRRTRLPYNADHETWVSDESARLTQQQLEAALEIRRLIEEAREIEDRQLLDGSGPDFRVRIKVLEGCLAAWRKSGSAGGNPTKGETEILLPGEVREGKGGSIRSLKAAPHEGGELKIDFEGRNPTRKGIYVTQLVSPETGDPNVDLQIFMKA